METSLLRSPAAINPRPATVVFAAIVTIGLAITVYSCRAMGHGLLMPGGWTMSMMWMQIPSQNWLGAAAQFLVMWLGMVSAMMLPLMVPVFLHTQRRRFLHTERRWMSLCLMAGGYYAVWLMAGLTVYGIGAVMAEWTLHSDQGSRLIPFCRSGMVIAAGLFQFTHWKQSSLSCCRPALRQSRCCPPQGTSFRLGCRHGLACCICCAAPMIVQLALGIMHPVVMITIAIAIAAERLLPRPRLTATALGIAAILTAVVMIRTLTTRPAEHPNPIDCSAAPMKIRPLGAK